MRVLNMIVLVFVLGLCEALPASEAAKQSFGPDAKVYQDAVAKAVQYLAAAQAEDGSLSARIGIGPTALATLGLLRNGRGAADPQVAKGLKYLEDHVQSDGGVYAPRSRISTYETCIAIVCLQAANADGRYDKIVRPADKFIRSGQWDESQQKEKSDVGYGGAGYGGKTRPDLSNTAFMIDALKAAGAKPDDAAIQRALIFVSRCQNLESEHNSTPFAAKVNDGGFYYTPAESKQSPDRQTPNGGLRSYGSMTYSGLKSMVYAGLKKDDPRVKAAATWIRKNYDVKSNPGMGSSGLYYYYLTFAKALDALGENEIEDGNGVKHDWRRELVAELVRRQQPNGSWVNTNTQWMEGDPNLATAFALVAMSYCRPAAAVRQAP